MIIPLRSSIAAGLILILGTLVSNAVTFTNDSRISFNDTTYEGEEIVVSDCKLIIDGTHTFGNLHILNGGVVTHSSTPSGTFNNNVLITDELHTLIDTNAVTLFYTNVVSGTVVVRDSSGSITYTNNVDYHLTIQGGVAQINRLPATTSILDGEVVVVSYQTQDYVGPVGMYLTITNNLEIEPGGVINLVGRGYGGSFGFGPGQSRSTNSPSFYTGGSGAGHGGFGGNSASGATGGTAYGSPNLPLTLGSGGGTGGGLGGAGGGAARITVRNQLRVDGLITADGLRGTNSSSGGGAGGSLLLSTIQLSGTGNITANGGSGELYNGGGGGGGRISVSYEESTFVGGIVARGGAGWVAGGAGTIYMSKKADSYPSLILDNGGSSGASTPNTLGGTFDMIIRNGAFLTVTNLTVRDLSIQTNGWIIAPSNQNLVITASRNVEIQANAGINADLKGASSGLGTGAGAFVQNGCPGGGYGGRGGAGAGLAASYGGNTYGILDVANLGSGGGGANGSGGTGGGSISITASSGTMTLHGRLTANGGSAFTSGGGGGSGGGIRLTAPTLSGSGSITAQGGSGDLPSGGGGGGGRIAINASVNLFNGTISAKGGQGWVHGGAGTIFHYRNYPSAGDLLVDNGGNFGAYTTFNTNLSLVNLTIQGGATVSNGFSSPLTYSNLWIRSNSVYIGASSHLSVSNAIIESTAAFTADGRGNTIPGFPSYPQTLNGMGGGGGYGGFGGRSLNGAAGGSGYGNISTPTDLGAAGAGPINQTGSYGGAGGGAVRFTVNGLLTLNGALTANGQVGVAANSGGGSGGSIYLTVSRLAGAGVISALGGAGESPSGGGGGGGRIALYYGTNDFSGTILAQGGAGPVYGGAGTVFLKKNTAPYPQLLVDNGGFRGASTPFTFNLTCDLSVQNGGVLLRSNAISTPFPLNNLFIGSNSWGHGVAGTINSNLTIEATGGITADGFGSLGGFGPGVGVTAGGIGGGGGHGGNGGNAISGGAGGGSHGTVTLPTTLGGGGGNNATLGIPTGGAGGGALQIVVNGTLSLNGTITANGLAGSTNAGGGAGGSLFFNVQRITGNGLITANGGSAGLGLLGGGGGGGRIAIMYATNLFSGSIQARGGPGATYGGAGTIYLKANNNSVGQIIMDNGGVRGAVTTIPSTSNTDLFVNDGAITAIFGTTTSFRSLVVRSNGLLTASATNSASLSITLSGDLTVERDGVISVQGLGYNTSSQTGRGSYADYPNSANGGGGGHGGFGGNGFYNAAGGPTYDNIQFPTQGGGAGGGTSGGNGGGVINFTITSNLLVHGSINANGDNGRTNGHGGGAGGSINLTVGRMLGAGKITANGGAGEFPNGGGGGGGRIAINYSTNQFAGELLAIGGSGANHGGAGTIYLKANSSQFPQIIIANNGTRGANTPVFSGSTYKYILTNGAYGYLAASTTTINDLLISSNSWLTYTNLNVTLTVENATIAKGGSLDLQSKGSMAGSGPGLVTGSGGAGHGGLGGIGTNQTSGASHGSISQPTSLGSGAALPPSPYTPLQGAFGGGALRLTVNKALQLDGEINANGGSGVNVGTGGGSGGSIWLTVGRFGGTGSMSANGGAGKPNSSGGGGGGRIALYCATNNFLGTVSAYGGTGFKPGGAGTIYSQLGQIPPFEPAVVYVDNAGLVGGNTPVGGLGGKPRLLVSQGAIVIPTGELILESLVVFTNSAIIHTNGQTNLSLVILDNAVIEGTISADGKGYSGSNGGPGAGQLSSNRGGGGGYGGVGGSGNYAGALGGNVYGSAIAPTDRGSRGGIPSSLGGYSEGGGAIRLKVGGILSVMGDVSADGKDALMEHSGGGAGGSIWINARTLLGAGSITADGGDGEPVEGGGGGGGRIAIYATTNVFTGSVSVQGGEGWNNGGVGTLFYAPNSGPVVIAQTPSGTNAAAMFEVELTFDSPIDFSTVSPGDFSVTTPNGAISAVSLGTIGATGVEILFPLQNTLGDYTVYAGPNVANIYGVPMSSGYVGTFSISPLSISGFVTNTNGAAIEGVLIQTNGLSAGYTDTNGFYTLAVPPRWDLTVTASQDGYTFIPAARSYTNLTTNAIGQGFMQIALESLKISSERTSTNLLLSVPGISGVTYQVYQSSNLIDWLPYGGVMPGSNGLMQVDILLTNGPGRFYQFRLSN